MTIPPDTLPVNVVMVVHGPEIFDSGEVAWLLTTLKPTRTVVAGVMARTAAEESHLPVEFSGKPPSDVIRATPGSVFLANRGKMAESGRIFGEIIASRLGNRGLVHIECSSRTIFCWNGGDIALGAILSRLTGYEVERVTTNLSPLPAMREIRGCIPGEAVYVNGIIIGRATAETVMIRWGGGAIEPVAGLQPKPHGIEKLSRTGQLDLATAWCKSGTIRAAVPKATGCAPEEGRVLVIDHCGHEFYARLPDDCCGVLAIGDDTTMVCGHICLHRGIPVLGIVDGDQDVIVPSGFARGSVIVEAIAERDDDIGAEVAGRARTHMVRWTEWVDEILSYLQGRVTIIQDLRESRDGDDAVRPV